MREIDDRNWNKGYLQVDIIVDGGLEDSINYTDYVKYENCIVDISVESEQHGLPVEIYVVEHNHLDDGEECTCVQYSTDHHPVYTWNINS